MVEPLVPKISYFGLARYSPLGKKLDFTRWLAPETLRNGNHTEKSDVWSFAVLMWETFTLGGSPYVDLSTSEVPERVTRGLRLKRPRGVSIPLYRLMQQCWHQQARDRPTFQELRCSLQALQPDALQFTYSAGYAYDKFNPLADEA